MSATKHPPLSIGSVVTCVLLASGCQRETVGVEAVIQVALPQNVAIEWVAMSAVAGGEELPFEEVEPLTYRVELPAGVEAVIDAELLDARIGGLFELRGNQTFVTAPGEQTVVIDALELPTVSGTVRAIFESGQPLLADFPIDLEDSATATSVPAALHAGEPYVIPSGRTVVFRAQNPITGEPLEVTVDGNAGFGDAVLDAGPAPELPTGKAWTSGAGIDVSGLLGTDTPYTEQCAFIDACADGSTDLCADDAIEWSPCDASLPVTPSYPHLEGCYGLAFQYAEVGDSCTALIANYDRTPPRVGVRFDPDVLLPGDPERVTVIIEGNESLRGDSITVALSAAPGTNVCAVREDFEWQHVCHDIDLSGAPSGYVTVRARGTDLAGNPFDVEASFLDLAADPAAPDVVVGRFMPIPAPPDPQSSESLVRFELKNIGVADACNVSVDSFIVTPPPGSSFFPIAITQTLNSPSIAGGEELKMWALLEGFASPAERKPGTYTADITVSWEACPQGAVGSSSMQIPFSMVTPPARWLTNDAMYISPLTPNGFGEEAALTKGGVDRSSGYSQYHAFTSTDPNVVDFYMDDNAPVAGPLAGVTLPASAVVEMENLDPFSAQAEALTAQGQAACVAAGCTYLTQVALPGCACPEIDSVRVTVLPAGDLVALQPDRVVRMRRSLRDGLTAGPEVVLDPAIGIAEKLLWDPTRNHLVVVGEHGVQLLDAGVTITDPCGISTAAGDRILGAALTGVAPAHRNPLPDLALLLDRRGERRHCELALDDGRELLPTNGLPLPITCIPDALVSDPVSGEMTALGDDGTSTGSCAISYHTRDGVLGIVKILSGGRALLGDVGDAVYDSFANTVAMVTRPPLSEPRATAWSGGAFLDARPGGELSSCGLTGEFADAVAVFPGGGLIVATSKDDSKCSAGAGISRSLNFYADRMYASFPDQSMVRTEAVPTATTALAIDASSRTLYVGDDQGGIVVTSTDGAFSFSSDVPIGLPTAAPIVDLIVAGPQPLFQSVGAVVPGQTVTLSGTGFSGIADRVFVGGIEAAVEASSPTSVTFTMPWELSEIRDYVSVSITVAAHDVMSSHPYYAYHEVRPPVVGLSTDVQVTYGSDCTIAPCTFGTLMDTSYGARFKSSNAGISRVQGWDFSPFTDFPYGPPTPQRIVARRLGLEDPLVRLLGHDGSSWWEGRMIPTDGLIGESPRTAPLPVQGLDAFTISDDERLVAVAAEDDVYFHWGSTLTPYADDAVFGIFGDGSRSDHIAELAFDREGDELLVARSNGEVRIIDLRTSPPVINRPTDINDLECPATGAGGQLLRLSAHGPGSELTLIATDGATVGLWALMASGGWSQVCLGTVQGIPAGNTMGAAVSPRGDHVVIADGGLAGGTVRVVHRNDPTYGATQVVETLGFEPIDVQMPTPYYGSDYVHVSGASQDFSIRLNQYPFPPRGAPAP